MANKKYRIVEVSFILNGRKEYHYKIQVRTLLWWVDLRIPCANKSDNKIIYDNSLTFRNSKDARKVVSFVKNLQNYNYKGRKIINVFSTNGKEFSTVKTYALELKHLSEPFSPKYTFSNDLNKLKGLIDEWDYAIKRRVITESKIKEC